MEFSRQQMQRLPLIRLSLSQLPTSNPSAGIGEGTSAPECADASLAPHLEKLL